MNTISTEWNTRREYTADGQIIRATFTPTEIADDNNYVVGTLDFDDTSRGITGRFDRVSFFTDGWENEDGTYPDWEITEAELQEETLRRYDEVGYR